MKITVYLGAREGNDSDLKNAVRELGSWIGVKGHVLVYGGSKTGLMGELEKSAIAAGAEVIGVETKLFVEYNYQCEDLTQLIVAEDISERKAIMAELGDAFIAFPGGTGTLEEISDIMSKVSLKLTDSPCIIYNLNGYYNGLRELLNHMTEKGLSTEERQSGIFFAENLAEIEKILSDREASM